MPELPLTFHVPSVMAVLSEVQKGCRSRVLNEGDVREFLDMCLRLGFMYKMYPDLNADGFSIVSHGGCARGNVRASYMVLTNHSSMRNDVSITIFRGLVDKASTRAKNLRAELYNTEYAHDFYSKIPGHSIFKHIYLKDVPIKASDITCDKMPLYINIPILCVYAKERLAGDLPLEALC